MRGVLAVFLAVTAVWPAAAAAQYTAPPPDPGFSYIFDGTPTGSDASFDRWTFASSTAAASATQGMATLDTAQGAINVGASPFGAYWYPVRPLGDAVIRLQYTVQDTPASTRNGGVMIRSPEIRYTGADTAAVLAQKPLGYNFDVCPGALAVCGLSEPAASTTYTWAGAPGPFPPAGEYSGAYCARTGTHNITNLAGTGPLTTNNNANNHQHWTQVYCGHEIQINESLAGGGPQPSSDPIKTGSVYGFRNLNAKQSGTNERLVKGVWHDMEIRTIGQQYTVLVDGELINQFDNSVPKIASRNGDPPTVARQLARGYLGLQTHGGNDRISYREIQVKELAPADLPVSVTPPSVSGSGFTGQPLTCSTGEWQNAASTWVTWYRSNPVGPTHPHYRAPSQLDLGNFSTPPEPEYGTSSLTWLDSLIVGQGATYTPTAEDVGKVLHCAVSADNGGATVWKTAVGPPIVTAVHDDGDVSGTVPATLSLTLGTAATFGAFTPGVARDYDASMTASVISSAGDAALSVTDTSSVAPGHLVNGAFVLPSALEAAGSSAAGTGAALASVSGSPLPLLTYPGPVANDPVTLSFRQRIGANDALRTGTYSKTLTFTLSTTTP
ncbi:MAG TPA: DUF1080 domain-containing protein [Solirubrobacteraceae bacterium]|nr:DUF1080 domain-containing protein [Solirubrobacteraceae bacterium]